MERKIIVRSIIDTAKGTLDARLYELGKGYELAVYEPSLTLFGEGWHVLARSPILSTERSEILKAAKTFKLDRGFSFVSEQIADRLTYLIRQEREFKDEQQL